MLPGEFFVCESYKCKKNLAYQILLLNSRIILREIAPFASLERSGTQPIRSEDSHEALELHAAHPPLSPILNVVLKQRWDSNKGDDSRRRRLARNRRRIKQQRQ